MLILIGFYFESLTQEFIESVQFSLDSAIDIFFIDVVSMLPNSIMSQSVQPDSIQKHFINPKGK